MDLGITNKFIFDLRSWLILSIVISQPSFDHRLTLTIYLTAPVWVNQFKRNREFGSIYSSKVPRYVPRFQELNKDFVLLHPFQKSHHSVLYPTNTHPVFFLRLWSQAVRRVPGLGQITWWIVCWQKMRSHIGKKLFGNREIVFNWTVGVWEHTDSLTQSPNWASPETNTNTQSIFFVSSIELTLAPLGDKLL